MTRGTQSRTVGVDIHSVDGIHQGIRTHCLELFGRIVQLAEDINFVFLLSEPENLLRDHLEFERPNVKLVRMPKRPAPVRLLRQLPVLAREHRLDLLHCQYIVPPICPCPTAVTIHDTLFESHPQFYTRFFVARSRFLMRNSAKKSALVCTVSDFSRDELVRRYRLESERVATVYNGVNSKRFRPADDSVEDLGSYGIESGKYLLSVGRLEPRKNQVRLVEAYASLPEPRPKLVLVGQRDFGYQDVLRIIESQGLRNDLILLENVDDAQLPVLYRHALAFVYPSLAEGFGMPILEAMASGVPVVTSNNTALSEVSEDAAILVDPESAPSIADGMRQVLASEDLRRKLVSRGFLRAEKYQWENSATVLVEAYRSFFSRKSHCAEGVLVSA